MASAQTEETFRLLHRYWLAHHHEVNWTPRLMEEHAVTIEFKDGSEAAISTPQDAAKLIQFPLTSSCKC
jgi:hypothetical protein